MSVSAAATPHPGTEEDTLANLALQADLEKFLQIDVTAEPDAAITAYLESASAIIESYCGRIFALTASIIETHDGGKTTLWLGQPPVTAIGSVVEDGVTLVENNDYRWWADGKLTRLTDTALQYSKWWYPNRQTVTVTYNGGYATIPYDVRDVCVRIAARAFQAGAAFAAAPASAGAVRSVTLAGSDSVTYADAVTGSVATAAVQMTDDDRKVLDHYRLQRPRFGFA